jgi:hypothetical protein
MKVIEIRITVPDDAKVSVNSAEADVVVSNPPYVDPVARYWRDYLSASGRKLYAAAASIERHKGPGFTFDDLAETLSVTYDSVQSWHRNSGRTAKRWRSETSLPEPIRFEMRSYEWEVGVEGMRTRYGLPEGVGERILELQAMD